MAEKIKFPCIQVAEGEINQRVITCGDPARAELISKFFDDPVCMAKNREFWTFNGTYKGVPVSVTSHGVGCGGAAIAFESMWRAGAKVFVWEPAVVCSRELTLVAWSLPLQLAAKMV